MGLYADAVNLDSLFLEHPDHACYAVTLAWAPGVEVIVVEFGIGIILVCKLESQTNHLITVTVKGVGPEGLAV